MEPMIFSFPVWITAIAFAVALIAALVAFFLHRSRKPRGIVIVASLAAFLIGGVIAPMIALDRVTLDEERLHQRTGFWFIPTNKGFALESLESITVAKFVDRNGLPNDLWVGTYEDGHTEEVDPGDLWDKNGGVILEELAKRGIEIHQ